MLNIKFKNTRKNLFWQIIFCAPRMLDGLDLSEIIIWMGFSSYTHFSYGHILTMLCEKIM